MWRPATPRRSGERGWRLGPGQQAARLVEVAVRVATITQGTVSAVTHVASFLALAVVVIVTPGQDTALTIRNTLLGGRQGGVATAVGVAAGQAVWALATSAGLAVILETSHPAFVALRMTGAAYLVYLGGRALSDAVRLRRRKPGGDPTVELGSRIAPRRALRQGLISNLGNPKMAVFFTSLLPQFVTRGHTAFSPLLLLGLVFALMTLIWLTVYALAVAKARALLLRSRVRRVIDAVTAAVLVAFGVRLASESG
jgi:threonine/homoserine/homoserine lactone efflux protein